MFIIGQANQAKERKIYSEAKHAKANNSQKSSLRIKVQKEEEARSETIGNSDIKIIKIINIRTTRFNNINISTTSISEQANRRRREN